MASLTFRPATIHDDDALKRLWRETPMPGRVALAFEREPSAFYSAALQGDVHQTLIAVEEGTGFAAGSAGRAELAAFVNGQPTRVGYLSELRIHPRFRLHRTLLADGWAHFREMHARGKVPLYVTTIFADNSAARRFLEKNRPGWPVYVPRDHLTTMVATLRPPRGVTPRGVQLSQATVSELAEVSRFLERAYAAYQFAPQWSPETLQSQTRCRGLAAEDFTIARRDGQIVGCLAVWDQREFKQTVVHGYSGGVFVTRRLLNLVAPLLGRPLLPKPGEKLQHAYLSHIAVENDDVGVFLALARKAMLRVRERRYAYLTFTLAHGHPLHAAARRSFDGMSYDSLAYMVHFGDAAGLIADVDRRPIHLEAAIL